MPPSFLRSLTSLGKKRAFDLQKKPLTALSTRRLEKLADTQPEILAPYSASALLRALNFKEVAIANPKDFENYAARMTLGPDPEKAKRIRTEVNWRDGLDEVPYLKLRNQVNKLNWTFPEGHPLRGEKSLWT